MQEEAQAARFMEIMQSGKNLLNQGLNGDLTELQPDGSASLEEQYRWIEWKSYFGTPQNQARLEFLQIVEPMFEEIGVNTEDPLKEPTEEAFEEC